MILSCNQQSKTETTTSAKEEVIEKVGFIHAVYFWLNDDNPELLNEFVDDGLSELAKVPSIQNVYWGPPAGTPRDVVDNSYDIAWIVMFESSEKHDEYQKDSLHLYFIDRYQSLFDSIQIYDNLVE